MKKKTIYYDNALIKVYDIPILYIPKLSHPDPTVDRRSGFLPPTITDSKNLGTAISLPYFFDIGRETPSLSKINSSSKVFTYANGSFSIISTIMVEGKILLTRHVFI